MEAPLSICTKEEMRGVIRFLFVEDVKPVEIIRRMQAEYGDNCLSRSKIYEWIEHFKKGRTSICDEERSGRPSTSRNENNIQAVERTVRENRRITVDDMAEASICLAQ
jgi:transposase